MKLTFNRSLKKRNKLQFASVIKDFPKFDKDEKIDFKKMLEETKGTRGRSSALDKLKERIRLANEHVTYLKPIQKFRAIAKAIDCFLLLYNRVKIVNQNIKGPTPLDV